MICFFRYGKKRVWKNLSNLVRDISVGVIGGTALYFGLSNPELTQEACWVAGNIENPAYLLERAKNLYKYIL